MTTVVSLGFEGCPVEGPYAFHSRGGDYQVRMKNVRQLGRSNVYPQYTLFT